MGKDGWKEQHGSWPVLGPRAPRANPPLQDLPVHSAPARCSQPYRACGSPATGGPSTWTELQLPLLPSHHSIGMALVPQTQQTCWAPRSPPPLPCLHPRQSLSPLPVPPSGHGRHLSHHPSQKHWHPDASPTHTPAHLTVKSLCEAPGATAHTLPSVVQSPDRGDSSQCPL